MVRYQRALYNAALWIVRNADDARDVTQEVFLKVAVRLDEYDPRYKFFSWIYRIAVNESLNLLRRSGREEELDEKVELPAGDSVNPEWQLGEAQKSRRIRARADEHVGERPDGIDAEALFRTELRGDRGHPGTGREDGEIAAVRGKAAIARVAPGPANQQNR